MNKNKKRLCRVFTIYLGFALLFGFSATVAQGQTDTAYWQVGNGNWSNAANWQCYNPNFGSCVPSEGYVVQPFPGNSLGQTVTLDQSATVFDVFFGPASGGPGVSMTISGTSLTTTDTSGVPSANFDNLTINSGGSVTAAGGISAQTINANDATLNANVSAVTANIIDSTIKGSSSGLSLEAGDLTLQNSVVGPNGGGVTSVFDISNSKITGVFGFTADLPSTITGSTFSNISSGTVELGATLDIKSSTLGSAGGGITVDGGDLTVESGTKYQGLGVVNVMNDGTATVDGKGTIVTLTRFAPGVLVDSTSTLNVQNGAQLTINVPTGPTIGTVLTQGDVTIGSGSSMTLNRGNWTQSEVTSTTTVNGTLSVPSLVVVGGDYTNGTGVTKIGTVTIAGTPAAGSINIGSNGTLTSTGADFTVGAAATSGTAPTPGTVNTAGTVMIDSLSTMTLLGGGT